MYLPNLSDMPDRRSLITTPTPFSTSRFTLDTSGISGFFGGDEAISAMTTVHFYKYRQWLGWYNTPGSFQIARRYGLVARSAFFEGLFPGVRIEPAELVEFDGWKGEKFQAVRSGTIINTTNRLASALIKECASMVGVPIPGREGSRVGVTIVRLKENPPAIVKPKRPITCIALFGIIPIASSLTACIASVVYHDWISFSLILWGMLSNGISCLVIGRGTLFFTHPGRAAGSPHVDGILGTDIDKEFVLLQGSGNAISSVTHGKFSLELCNGDREYVGWCSVLLTIQFIAQLFLIPQASLFGQVMFLFSLAVSWIYNLCLSAVDKEKILGRTLLEKILSRPLLKKYILPNRAAAVVFALCILRPEEPEKIVEAYLPNKTRVWRKWKEIVLEGFPNRTENRLDFTQADLEGFTSDEKELLRNILQDAKDAYEGFLENEGASSATDTV